MQNEMWRLVGESAAYDASTVCGIGCCNIQYLQANLNVPPPSVSVTIQFDSYFIEWNDPTVPGKFTIVHYNMIIVT